MNAVRMHWTRDILHALAAEILVCEIEFGLDLVEGLLGDANPAGLGESLQTGSDVDSIAIDVFAFDNDIAQMHSDAEVNATLLGYFRIAFSHAHLYGKRAFHRVNHAGELNKRTITHQLDDIAAVISDTGVDQLVPMAFERAKHTHLISLHEA